MLHVRFNCGDENIRRHHPVLGSEALGKIVRIENLGIGWEFVVSLPDQNLYLVIADEIKLIARVAVVNFHRTHFLAGSPEFLQLRAEGESRPGQGPSRERLMYISPQGISRKVFHWPNQGMFLLSNR